MPCPTPRAGHGIAVSLRFFFLQKSLYLQKEAMCDRPNRNFHPSGDVCGRRFFVK
ncbi:hypothetical protein [Microcoleus sp. A006_D1]|uniref:hypothetical protein n=1 Tax=Microcoleus sp. A006_D1 TaxID=3055267 RepID=UPI002FD6F5A0